MDPGPQEDDPTEDQADRRHVLDVDGLTDKRPPDEQRHDWRDVRHARRSDGAQPIDDDVEMHATRAENSEPDDQPTNPLGSSPMAAMPS